MDFKEDVILMGHDGHGHLSIPEVKTKIRPLGIYHYKVGNDISEEMSVKNGAVTLLSVAEQGDGKLVLLFAEAERVELQIFDWSKKIC